MPGQSIEVGELIYEVVVQFTGVTDYGVEAGAILEGRQPTPLEGAQIDFAFQGSFEGPRLRGSIVGVDYARARADGRIDLHIHAALTTDDGARIAFFADGVATRTEGAEWPLRENCSFLTAAPAYAWLNRIQAWGAGTVDLGKGEVRIRVYAA